MSVRAQTELALAVKEGRKEGSKEARKQGRKEGRKEARKQGSKAGWVGGTFVEIQRPSPGSCGNQIL